ncbi:MAG: transposase [Desulfamplus sp.]
MEKFKNKYRIASARATWWNYGWAGAYFITICTQNREHFFGEIKNYRINLSRVGVIADILWHEIPYHAKNVELGSFVVMPNHIHGILILTENNTNTVETLRVETLHATSLQQKNQNKTMSAISPKPDTVSAIIRSYKSAVTKHANRLGFTNGWQSRFHDHIIRNDAEYQRINDYIETNPSNWENDVFFAQEE